MNSVHETPIARTTLTIEVDGKQQVVPVTIYLPQAVGEDWRCAYEIGWPSGPRRAAANGVDSVQALLLAMQMIGAELYAACPPGAGYLAWLAEDDGFGFPLPPSMRDLAIGEDRLI